MARGLITPSPLSRILSEGPIVLTNGDASNGHSFDNSGQNLILVAYNSGVSTATIGIPKRLTADGDSFENEDLDLDAGEYYAFDYFENTYYGWNDADNSLENLNAVIINVSSSDIKLFLLPAGNRATLIA